MKNAFLRRPAKYVSATIIAIVLGVLFCIMPHRGTANAASGVTISPNLSNMESLKYLTKRSGEEIYESDPSASAQVFESQTGHIIKNEQSSIITELKTAAYFSDASNTAQFNIVQINGKYDRCHITDTSNYYANKPFAYVKTSFLNTAGNTVTQTFSIYKKNVFVAPSDSPQIKYSDECFVTNGHANKSDADAGGAGVSKGTTFFGAYGIKNFSTAAPDPDTGLFKVNISVSYDSKIEKILDSGPNKNYQQQISFQEQLTACTASQPTCARYLSTVPFDTGLNNGVSTARNYSTLRSTTKRTNGASLPESHLRQRFGFGLPCTEMNALTKTVSLYDIDNGAYDFKSGFYVEKYNDATGTWSRLRKNSPEITNLTNGTWESSDNFGNDSGHQSDQAIVAARIGSGDDTSFSLKMQPQTRYRLTVTPISTTNLLGIGLPTETIFGDIGCNYNLRPTISSTSSDTVSPGQQITLDSSVIRTNSQNFSSPNADWWITKIITTGAVPSNPTDDTDGQPCAPNGFVSPPGSSCVDTTWRTNQAFSTASTSRSVNYTVEDVPAGSKICFIASVHPPSNTSPKWRHSAPLCYVSGKKPKIQVWGGDVRSGGVIDTSITASADTVYGSWVEYGAFSIGKNVAFGSGAALRSGIASTADRDVWSKLTFANVDAASNARYGYYASTLAVPAPESVFHQSSSTGTLNPDLGAVGLSSGRYQVGNFTINRSNITQVGRWIIVDATGATVTINDDITYGTTNMTSIDDIPQVVIIADNIIIKPNVGRIDAWLLAKNTINTCSDIPAGNPSSLNSTKCTKQLTVNGPVATDKLYLYRTANAEDGTLAEPAERFNLRADAYLWIYHHMSGNGIAQTVYTNELPPRF